MQQDASWAFNYWGDIKRNALILEKIDTDNATTAVG